MTTAGESCLEPEGTERARFNDELIEALDRTRRDAQRRRGFIPRCSDCGESQDGFGPQHKPHCPQTPVIKPRRATMSTATATETKEQRQLKRLANYANELKDQLNALEARLDKSSKVVAGLQKRVAELEKD
jgi:peptidoglycan hydrolase CwlO-like protein